VPEETRDRFHAPRIPGERSETKLFETLDSILQGDRPIDQALRALCVGSRAMSDP
jgi:hypothetical protein